jgi:hypothetical protein
LPLILAQRELLEKQHTALNPSSVRTVMQILHLRIALFVLLKKTSMYTVSHSPFLSLSFSHIPLVLCVDIYVWNIYAYIPIFKSLWKCFEVKQLHMTLANTSIHHLRVLFPLH